MHVILLGIIPFILLAVVLGLAALTWFGSVLLRFPVTLAVLLIGWLAYRFSHSRPWPLQQA